MHTIEIREYTDIDMSIILSLYHSVGWVNYTNQPSMLESAFLHSLKILGAWCKNELVGIIRAVGDGYSIVYIQDIIVLPEYQKRGIGRKLIDAIDALYPHVYQKVLLTDNQLHTISFYEHSGFFTSDKYSCVALVKFNS